MLLLVVACSPASRYIATIAEDGTSIVVFDPTLSHGDTIEMTSGPARGSVRTLALSSGGEVIYVAAGGQHSQVSAVRRYDGDVLNRWELPPGLTPQSLALLRTARQLLVSYGPAGRSADSGGIALLAAPDLQEIVHLSLCEGAADGIAVMKSGKRAFVRCEGRATLAAVDLELKRVVRTVHLAAGGSTGTGTAQDDCGGGGIALSRTGGLLLIPCSVSGHLIYVDRLTLEPIDSVQLAPGAYYIAVDPRHPRALVASRDSARVVLVNLRTRSVETSIALPGPPTAITVSPDGRHCWITTQRGEAGTLVKLELAGGRVVATAPADDVGAVSLWPGQWSPVLTWR